ncbi:MAG: type III pantothenate kinase [Candidatus Limnocylindrales bacterium]
MLVAIDVGNSDVKLALVRHGRVITVRRVPTRSREAAYDVEGLLIAALGETSAKSVEAIALVSVVPPWTEAIAEFATHMRRPLLMADSRTIPLLVRLPDPDAVGPDRLLDAFAALRLHGAPVIVVDLGTATTIDAVDADGAFVGGAIAPGLGLGLSALGSGTARLPSVAPTPPERAIGRDTLEAIRSGAVFGHVGVVRELTSRIAAELVPDGTSRPSVVVTGGLSAAPWAGLLQGVDVLDPELTLKGLALLHAEVGAGVAS